MSQTFNQSPLNTSRVAIGMPNRQPTAQPTLPALTAQELSCRLQTTLDFEQMLSLFSDSIQTPIPHDGLTFSSQKQGIHLQLGRISRHSLSYSLNIDGDAIGEICVMRGRKFRDSEIAELENLLGGLGYPLRNGLLYRQALAAAQTDPLTQLHNRAAFDSALARELASFHRLQQPMALLLIDLDHFKRINDTLGHSAGDEVLRSVSTCLRKSIRKGDQVFRCGGEEFVALIRPRANQTAEFVAERLRASIAQCMGANLASSGLPVTASIGVAEAVVGDTPREIYDRADRAMYMAKAAGRNQVRTATHLSAQTPAQCPA